MANRRYPYTKPDQQGKFDGLCAVYSILNSIKLLYHVGEDDLDAMFRSLCESLPDKFPRALWDGLGVPEIRRLLNYSVDYLSKYHQYDDFHGVFHSFNVNSRQSIYFGDALANNLGPVSPPLS
jgi:hypothetical protein